MKSFSRFSAVIALACAVAAASCWHIADNTVAAIVRVYRKVRDFAVDLMVGAVASFARSVAERLPRLTAVIIAARHYLQRQVKRERPRRHAGWSFAPSA